MEELWRSETTRLLNTTEAEAQPLIQLFPNSADVVYSDAPVGLKMLLVNSSNQRICSDPVCSARGPFAAANCWQGTTWWNKAFKRTWLISVYIMYIYKKNYTPARQEECEQWGAQSEEEEDLYLTCWQLRRKNGFFFFYDWDSCVVPMIAPEIPSCQEPSPCTTLLHRVLITVLL